MGDRGIEIFELMDVTIIDHYDDVRQSVSDFNNRVFDSDSTYDRFNNNSNTYAGDVFEELTGIEVQPIDDIKLPGL